MKLLVMAGGVPFNRGLIACALVVLALRASPIACDTQELIATVCQSTEDHGFCTNVFKFNLKWPDTDMRGLAEIALRQGINNASASAKYAEDLYYQTKDPQLQQYLKTCSVSGYYPTLEHLLEGGEFLQLSSYDAMVSALLQAPKPQASSCDGQPTISGAPNPMNERNREMRILISMALATAFELDSGVPAAGNN
ncbi:hypothetical protein MLD38_036506 [Melastoma candidum]|uniref:Uncharacterized protein n=1 Tax=Melastoma candidum TaxID=119954 RepID=A0ACB9LJW7_9MYRT|nr:hypothetical protein MLD38_036506 [Melastoma candidum]